MNSKKYFLLLILSLLSSCEDSPTGTSNNNNQINVNLIEIADTTKGEFIRHTNYSLSYAEEYEQAYWVAYELVTEELEPNFERTDKFVIDPKVSTLSANGDDYRGSGYDRGHLMPAAVCVWDSVAMAESFFYSNISPQNASYNRGIWSRLEDLERELVVKYDTVWVVITPIFDTIIERIGDNQVAVPGAYGRAFIVKDGNTYKSCAFILNNVRYESGYDFINNSSVTIDSLEARTGFDLYFQLEDGIEDVIEGKINLEIFNNL